MEPRPTVSALEEHLGYWLRAVSNHVSHAFSRKVEAHGVTVAEWVVLRVLFERDAQPPSQVAEALGMTRGAISKLADRLEAKSLLLRTTDGADRRYQSLVLTEAGRALVPVLAALADRNDAEFFGQLTAEERQVMERCLKGIVHRLGIWAAPID